MKILVIGGTRFFGKDIVNLAPEAGHDVTVFSRGNLGAGRFEEFRRGFVETAAGKPQA